MYAIVFPFRYYLIEEFPPPHQNPHVPSPPYKWNAVENQFYVNFDTDIKIKSCEVRQPQINSNFWGYQDQERGPICGHQPFRPDVAAWIRCKELACPGKGSSSSQKRSVPLARATSWQEHLDQLWNTNGSIRDASNPDKMRILIF